MYNDYIIKLASCLFADRILKNWDKKTLVIDDVEDQADKCISIACCFWGRIKATLPPEPPIEILKKNEDETN